MHPIPSALSQLYALCTLPGLLASMLSAPGRRCWLKGSDGRYLWANDAFAGDAGTTAEQIVGRSTEEVWPQCWHELRVIDIGVIAERRNSVEEEQELTLGDGRRVSVLVTRLPLVDQNGGVAGVLGYYDCGQSEAHRAAEVQLMLSIFTDEQAERYLSGIEAIAGEFA